MANVYSIIYPRFDKNFNERFDTWFQADPTGLFVFYIEPTSFDEIHKFILNTKKEPKRCFFNMGDEVLVLKKHLSNWKYFKQFDIDIDKFIWLRADFRPIQGWLPFVENFNTGIIWWEKPENYLTHHIAAEWFDPKLIEKIYYRFGIYGIEVALDLDFHTNIVEKYLKREYTSSFTADCVSLDCLRSSYLKLH